MTEGLVDYLPWLLSAVTGYGQDSDRAKGRQAGFDAHLVKPAAYDAIAQILAGVEPRPA